MVKRSPSKSIDIEERPTHRTESEIRQTVELDQADNTPTDSESVGGPSLVKLEDKAIKDKAESTRVKKGKVNKVRARNDRADLPDKPKAKGKNKPESTKSSTSTLS